MTTTIEQHWNGKDVKIKGRRVINKSAYEIGLIVEAQAKALAPVETGLLRGSITTQGENQGSSPEVPAGLRDVIRPRATHGEVYVGTAVNYAPYVEFGTIRSRAQAFLRPALDLAKGKALTIVENNGRFEFKEYLR